MLCEIGRGNGSIVYLVRHQKLGDYRAVKRIPKDDEFVWQIREADILNHLKHPQIPKVYDMEEDEDAYYIIEDYIEGESLEAVMLQSSFITLNFIYQIITQVADIIDYMHHLKPEPMVYQDLKADHIIIGKDGIHLIDFGIAVCVSQEGNKFQNYGTLDYCAPEKRKEGRIGIQTDVYSLGKILEKLICAEGKKESIHLMHIVKRATSANLEWRYTTIGAFLADFTESMQSEKKSELQKHLLKKIVVTGSQSHIGVTHLSITLTAYLNQQNCMAVYQEKNISKIHRAFQEGGFVKESGLYRRENFLGVPAYGQGVLVDMPKDAIEVIDYGTDIEQALKEEADVFLLLVGSREWEVEYADLAFKMVREKEGLAVISNYGNRAQAKTYAKAYQQKVYCFPLDENPFFMTKEKEKLFEGLLVKKGGEIERKCNQNHWSCRKYPWKRSNPFIRGFVKLCRKRLG